MAGLSTDQIPDLLNSTLPMFDKDGGFDSTLENQTYPIIDKLFNQYRRKARAGESISLRIQLRTTGTAMHTELFEATPNTIDNTTEKIEAGWTHTENKMHYDVREMIMNSSPADIFDMMKARRFDMFAGKADLIELDCLKTPNDINDKKNPLGFPYWICPVDPGSEDPVGGFNGTTVVFRDASTSTVTGGIDRSLARNARFRNWCATYDEFGASTLELMRKACRYVNFNGPRVLKKINQSQSPIWGWFVNLDIADQYEAMVNAGPDDRNGDYSPFNGMLSFKKIPVYATAALGGISYDPIYLINTNAFFPYVLRGRWMQVGKAIPGGRSEHNSVTVPLDSSWQMFCKNVREGGAIIHKPIAA